MISAAEAGQLFGIPPERLESMIEHPKVAELIFVAQAYPELKPEQILQTITGLPLVKQEGSAKLDMSAIERELSGLQQLEERGDGRRGQAGERGVGYPMLTGELEKAKTQADRRLRVLVATYDMIKFPPKGSTPEELIELIHGAIRDEMRRSRIQV